MESYFHQPNSLLEPIYENIESYFGQPNSSVDPQYENMESYFPQPNSSLEPLYENMEFCFGQPSSAPQYGNSIINPIPFPQTNMESFFRQPNSLLEPIYENIESYFGQPNSSVEPQYENMESYFPQPNSSLEPLYDENTEFCFGQPSSVPQYGNSRNLDFSNPDSSEFNFSLGNPTSFTEEMQTPHLYPPPCTSFPAMQPVEAVREAIFMEAVMHPVVVDEESLRAPPKRKNVRLSTDQQSVASRKRREKIGHRLRVLQRLVPGSTKMDTASMLDEACHYLRFLKRRKEVLEQGYAQDYRPVMGDAFFPGGASSN